MPELDEQLPAFGRWLDAELETAARRHDVELPTVAAPLGTTWPAVQRLDRRRERRERRVVLVLAALVSAAAAVAVLMVIDRRRLDVDDTVPISPGTVATVAPPTTAPPPVSTVFAPVPTATAVAEPGRVEPTTTSIEPAGPASASPRSPATASTTSPEVVTTYAPSPTTPPPVPTTVAATIPLPPATTAPPDTTAPSACFTDLRRVGRVGIVSFSVCADGIRLTQASVVSPGWGYTVTSLGPPTVVVEFASGATTVSCTLKGSLEAVESSGDC